MNKLTRFDRIQKHILSPEDSREELSTKDLEILHRYEAAFAFWLNNPALDDKAIVSFMMNHCGISKSMAYNELSHLKRMMGCVRTASKEWYRHMVIEMCREAYRLAKARNDAKAMALAADKIGKYTKLDKDEQEQLPWDEILPPNFEPQADITILGLPKMDNIEQTRKKLRNKLLKRFDNSFVEDAEILGNE